MSSFASLMVGDAVADGWRHRLTEGLINLESREAPRRSSRFSVDLRLLSPICLREEVKH